MVNSDMLYLLSIFQFGLKSILFMIGTRRSGQGPVGHKGIMHPEMVPAVLLQPEDLFQPQPDYPNY